MEHPQIIVVILITLMMSRFNAVVLNDLDMSTNQEKTDFEDVGLKESRSEGDHNPQSSPVDYPFYQLYSFFMKLKEASTQKRSLPSTTNAQPNVDDTSNKNKTSSQKVFCKLKHLDSNITHRVNLVNDSALHQLLKNEKNHTNSSSDQEAVCQMLLLFAPWCPFSARLAPYYSALTRTFPDLELFAINAVSLNYWNARFGTVAVPNILLFHNGNFVSRFNYTEKNLDSLKWFVQNFTNLIAVDNIMVADDDYVGPVPTEPVEQTDYYLYLSLLVILVAVSHGCFKWSSIFSFAYNKILDLFNYEHIHND